MHHSPLPHSITGPGEGGRINLVSERLGPDWEAYGERSPISHGFRQGSTDEHRRLDEEERFLSLEGNVLNLVNKFDRLLEEEFGKRSTGGVDFPYYIPAMEPPAPPTLPAPDYGYSPQFSAPYDCYPQYQQYPTPPQPFATLSSTWIPQPYSPPLPSNNCNPLPYAELLSLPPTWNHQQQWQNPSALPLQQWSTMSLQYPQHYTAPPTYLQQQGQSVPYVFDNMPVRKEAHRDLLYEASVFEEMQGIQMQPPLSGSMFNDQGLFDNRPRCEKPLQFSEIPCVSNGSLVVCKGDEDPTSKDPQNNVHEWMPGLTLNGTVQENKPDNNIEKDFDRMLRPEEKSSRSEASEIWRSSSKTKALFDPVMSIMGHRGDDSTPEASYKEESPKHTSSSEMCNMMFTDGASVSGPIVNVFVDKESDDTVNKENDNGIVAEEKNGGEPRIVNPSVPEELDRVTVVDLDSVSSGSHSSAKEELSRRATGSSRFKLSLKTAQDEVQSSSSHNKGNGYCMKEPNLLNIALCAASETGRHVESDELSSKQQVDKRKRNIHARDSDAHDDENRTFFSAYKYPDLNSCQHTVLLILYVSPKLEATNGGTSIIRSDVEQVSYTYGSVNPSSEYVQLALSLQKYVFDSEAGKNALEMKNLVACTSFLLEQILVKTWVDDKDVEALRYQKLLVGKEEAAQKRHAAAAGSMDQKFIIWDPGIPVLLVLQASNGSEYQVQSEFKKAYEKGMLAKFWEPTHEDSLNLIAKLPVVASYFYHRVYTSLDYGANFFYMLGFSEPEMLAFATALNGLTGPLHELANQEMLLWIKSVAAGCGENISTEQLKDPFLNDGASFLKRVWDPWI